MDAADIKTLQPERLHALDGLRGLAVCLVLLYHARVPGFGAGFVGVDAFFVLSGFLITRIIASEVAAGTFGFAHFYARRARRLLPNLLAVVTASLVVALLVMPREELFEFREHALAALGFAINVILGQGTDYFAVDADASPLLMTWSLAVEEQFYIVVPILLFVTLRKRMRVRPILLALGLASLAGFILLGRIPDLRLHGYYSLPTRAWELLAGAWLALLPSSARRTSSLVTTLCIAAIVLAAADVLPVGMLSRRRVILTVLATAILIRNESSTKRAHALLASRPAVAVGLVSYSLYLWHWPALAFARFVATSGGELSPLGTGLALSGGIVLAVLAYRFVEVPFRRQTGTPPRVVLWRYGGAVATVAVLVILGGASRGVTLKTAAERCMQRHTEALARPVIRCQQGPGVPAVVVWGDSHADGVHRGFERQLATAGLTTAQATKAGCPAGAKDPPCGAFNEQAEREILAKPEIRTVILAGRWANYTSAIDPMNFRIRELVRSTAFTDDYVDRLAAVTARLVAAGKNVVLVTQPPELPFFPDRRQRVRSSIPDVLLSTPDPATAHVDASLAKQRTRGANELLRDLARREPRLCLADVDAALCKDGACLWRSGGRDVYADDDHISLEGVAFVFAGLDLSRCLPPPQVAH